MTFLAIKRALSNAAIIPVVVTMVCLVPFVGKAFHIDDPLFIWSAKQIQINPADFYGFSVNWVGWEMPMAEVTKNPPLACYYVALVGLLLGWSEVALHTAFLVPAVAAALGMYYLAKQFCSRPVLAALAAVLTPVFLVSSTNIMCDIMMLSLWVWAVALWVRGIKADKQLSLLFAAVLIAICALTKYFGISLLGLLFVYSLMQKRKLGLWVLFLLIPVAVLAGYQWVTYGLYGRGLLLDAASYATEHRWEENVVLFSKGLMGLTFTGGCIITGLFYIPLLWSRRFVTAGIFLMILFVLALTFAEEIGEFSVQDADGVKWGFFVQLGLMTAAGVSILGLGGADFWEHRDADSLLLLLWIFGTFIFASFINWAVNARSILPMVPAAGILLVRRIDRRSKAGRWAGSWRVVWPLVPAAVVALLVCWADYAWANTSRSAATAIHKRFENRRGNVWFQGHWGFQYYMQTNGYQAFDFKRPKVMSGDVVIVPSNNSFTENPPEKLVRPGGVFRFAPWRCLAMMKGSLGAGFYADGWGPLPFVVGPVKPEVYYIYIAN